MVPEPEKFGTKNKFRKRYRKKLVPKISTGTVTLWHTHINTHTLIISICACGPITDWPPKVAWRKYKWEIKNFWQLILTSADSRQILASRLRRYGRAAHPQLHILLSHIESLRYTLNVLLYRCIGNLCKRSGPPCTFWDFLQVENLSVCLSSPREISVEGLVDHLIGTRASKMPQSWSPF